MLQPKRKYFYYLLVILIVSLLSYFDKRFLTNPLIGSTNVQIGNVVYALTRENITFRENFEKLIVKRTEPAYEVLGNFSIQPASARIRAKRIFNNKSLVLWATEWHMTPIKDLTYTLTPFGVKVINYNLDDYRCAWQDCTLKSKLKVLTSSNSLEPNSTIKEAFVEAYKNDEEMKAVDVVFCGHPAALCELYLKLNKSVLVLPSSRYDMGRLAFDESVELNENFIKLSNNGWNVFGGNNLYDARFLQYYTGINPIYHIPSMCDYTGAQYTNQLNRYLILRRYDHGFISYFEDNFRLIGEQMNFSANLDILNKYTYEDLAKYRAVINIPYQVSVMTVFELYRMNVPMFFPSTELLTRWQVDHWIMKDRTTEGLQFNKRPSSSTIPAHASQSHIPDPRNEYDYNSTLYWMRFCDYYQVFPYGIIYNSINELVTIIKNIDDRQLWEISKNMEKYNIDFKKALLNKWRDILLEYASNSPNNPN